MINFETIEFIGFLNELARKTAAGGIKSFAEAKQNDSLNTVFYDETSKYCVDDTDKYDQSARYKIVCDSCVLDYPDCYHHDIINYFDSDTIHFLRECEVYALIEKIDDTEYRSVCISVHNNDYIITVEDGRWSIT